MLVVMHSHATPEQVEDVVGAIRRMSRLNSVGIGGHSDEIKYSNRRAFNDFDQRGDELFQRLRVANDHDEVLDEVRHDCVMARGISWAGHFVEHS